MRDLRPESDWAMLVEQKESCASVCKRLWGFKKSSTLVGHGVLENKEPRELNREKEIRAGAARFVCTHSRCYLTSSRRFLHWVGAIAC
jgi:hypothetical protein